MSLLQALLVIAGIELKRRTNVVGLAITTDGRSPVMFVAEIWESLARATTS